MTLNQITKVKGPGIHTLANIVSNSISLGGIATASNFKTGTTNVHNVGVEAAGINVLGADTPIGTGATIYDAGGAVFTGVVTATKFVGQADISGGSIVSTSATFTGNVSIGGTLTYEDVTNIDSVGVITARDGINVTGGTVTIPNWLVHADDPNTKFGFEGPDTITFETAGSERLRINSEGKLLIDRTVSSTSGNHPALEIETICSGSEDTTFATGIDFKVDGVHKKRLAVTDGTGEGGGDWIFYRDNGTNEALHITSAGNVGINENNPGAQLVVKATTDDNPALQLFRASTGGDIASINWQTNAGSQAKINYRGAAGASEGLQFYTAGGSSSEMRMIIDHSGRMGLGTNDPENKLKINVAGSNDGVVVQNTSTDKIAMYGARNGDATIQMGQWGSTASGTSLGVSNTNLAFIYTTSYASTHPSALLIGNNGSIPLIFATAGTQKLRITSGGSVNIGGDYTQTSKKFKVTGNATIDGGLLVTGLLEGGSGFSIVNGNLTLPAYIYHDGDPDTYYGFSGANQFSVFTGGSERLRITSSGALIVNKDNDSTNSTLVLDKAEAGYAKLEFDKAGSQKAYVELDASEDLVHYGAANVNQLFYAGGGKRLTITNDKVMFSVDAKCESDNAIDLGASGAKWKDLYLNGIAYFGDNGSQIKENQVKFQSAGTAYIDHATVGQNITFRTSNSSSLDTSAMFIKGDGRVQVYCLNNSRGLELNVGSNAGSLVFDRNGHITSFIRASDGNSNVGGSSGGGSRMRLGKTQIHFDTFPYVTNVGDPVTYTTRLSIDSSGRTSVGRNLSSYVASSMSSAANDFIVTTGAGSNGGMSIVNSGEDIGNIFFAQGTSENAVGRIQYEHANNAFSFTTNSSERIRITNAGHLLIAQTTSNWGTTTANSVIQLKNGVVWDYAGVQFDVGHNYYYDGSDYHFIRSNYACRQTFHNNDGSIAFWSGGTGSADASLTWVDNVRILSNGRMGLGISAPEAVLHPRANPAHGTDTAFQVGTGNRYFKLNELSGQNNFSHCYISFHDNSLREILTLENSYAGLTGMGMEIAFRGLSSGKTGHIQAYNTTAASTQSELALGASGGTALRINHDKIITFDGTLRGNYGVDNSNGNSNKVASGHSQKWVSGNMSGGLAVGWYPIIHLTDGCYMVLLKTGAHSSILFTASNGYDPSNVSYINVLHYTNNRNGSYLNVDGLRNTSDGVIEVHLTASSSDYFYMEAQIIGAENIDNSLMFYNTLTKNTGSPTINDSKYPLSYGTGGMQLENVQVDGALNTSGSKNFRIPHPLSSLTGTKDLVHAAVEGPRADLIYRDKVDLVGGTATINIDTVAGMTEGTFAVLTKNAQCFTTNETGWTNVKGSISGNALTITAQDNSCTDTISWMVVAQRKDANIISASATDSNGDLILEPPSPLVDTSGQAPDNSMV